MGSQDKGPAAEVGGGREKGCAEEVTWDKYGVPFRLIFPFRYALTHAHPTASMLSVVANSPHVHSLRACSAEPGSRSSWMIYTDCKRVAHSRLH